MLVSAVQQSGSATCIQISSSCWVSLPTPPPSHRSHPELSSLSYAAASHELSILCMVVCIHQSHPNPSHLLLPRGLHVRCLYLRLCSRPTNRVICTVFLDCTHMCYNMIFVFLWLISLCMTDSNCIHASTSILSTIFHSVNPLVLWTRCHPLPPLFLLLFPVLSLVQML